MMNARIPALRNQAVIGLGMFLLGMWAAWELGGRIASNDVNTVYFSAMAFAGCIVAIATLRNWRSGFYLFLIWLLFEDLPRKYLGNNIALFFGKDVLAALIYISFFIAARRRQEKLFRPPFLLLLSLFVWLGVLQIFNQNSPHIAYGLLGFKLDFYYIPLMFVGYALIRSDEDLRKFVVVNAIAAGAIGGLGIAQAILGHSFLNPTVLAPELQDLGKLDKVTPLSNQLLALPSSVFVSTGRFSSFLILAFILVIGASGYLILYSHRGKSRNLVLLATGLIVGATLFSGARGAVVFVLASSLVLTVGFLWGAPWRWRQAHRLIRAIRRSVIVGALGLAAVLLLFPGEAASRIDYYTETLLPSSSAYEVTRRGWDYPIENLIGSFSRPNWAIGNGIGTASLGTQYVSKLIGQRPPDLWVEEGYGVLIVEMGILAPFLWLLWTGAMLYYAWKVVRKLRQTRFFPIAFAIWWSAFLLLYPLTFGSLASFQNYISNAYLWLTIGILFRLPDLLETSSAPVIVPSRNSAARGGFQF